MGGESRSGTREEPGCLSTRAEGCMMLLRLFLNQAWKRRVQCRVLDFGGFEPGQTEQGCAPICAVPFLSSFHACI